MSGPGQSDAATGGPLGKVPDAVEAAAAKTPLYINPFINSDGLVPERTDQGVDFGADLGAPIVAIANLHITRAVIDSGWPGPYGSPSGFNGKGGCIQGIVLDGPHKGEEVYLAEYIFVYGKKGQYVHCGEVIAAFYHPASSGVGVEFGWVKPGTTNPCSSDTSGRPTEGGINMTRWLNQLGCKTQQTFPPGPKTCPCGHH